jgi:ABC-2 type transport system ATP-binding protein
LLKTVGLTKRYKKFPVLKGVNINIEKGEVYGFLGKNGCGKTTTMNIICDIIPKDGGEVIFAPSSGRRKIGYLTESPALHGFMNGYEYLKYIAACADYKGDVNGRIREVLDLTGMLEGANRRVKGYSRGMNQRLGIAAAIFDNPELLILDEPTSALDPEGRAEVVRVIQRLKAAGTTIILCTHIISDAERVADKVGIMLDGVIAEEGYVEDIIRKYQGGFSRITVKFADPDTRTAALMREIPLVTASSYNERTGTVDLDSENADTLYDALLPWMAQNKIRFTEFMVKRANLEDVYFAVAGGKRA